MRNNIARVICRRADWCIFTDVSEQLVPSRPKRDNKVHRNSRSYELHGCTVHQ